MAIGFLLRAGICQNKAQNISVCHIQLGDGCVNAFLPGLSLPYHQHDAGNLGRQHSSVGDHTHGRSVQDHIFILLLQPFQRLGHTG